MASTKIKTEGPELALQNTIFEAVLASNLDVRAAISVLANVVAGIIEGAEVSSDTVLRLFNQTVASRLAFGRLPTMTSGPN